MQSFSEVIKEHFSRPLTGREFLAAVRRIGPLSEDTLEAIERQVKERRRSRMRVPPRWW